MGHQGMTKTPPTFGRRGSSLLVRFGIVAFVAVVAIGVILGLTLQRTVRNRSITDAARTGEVAANIGVRPLLEMDDLTQSFVPLSAERLAELDQSLGQSLSPDGIVRVKVWNRQHWLVYSDNSALVARWFAGSDELERSFNGEITSEITDLTAPEEREEREFGELLAVYVPLRVGADGAFTSEADGEILGAFEIYLPFAPIAAQIRQDTIRLWWVLGGGLLILYLSLFQLVARASRRMREQQEQNIRQATTDDLTGLGNRELFLSHLDDVLTSRSDPQPVTMLLLDLDGFQNVNDALGHEWGDQVLQAVAERLRDRVRDSDVVARLGGDEFAIVVSNDEAVDVAALVERFLAALELPVVIDGLQLDVHCSVGVSQYPTHGATANALLQKADVAMYAAKKNQSVWALYEPDLDHFTAGALELVSEVRDGIADGQFSLAYQPQLAVDTGELLGFEGLVRWVHPERGRVFPDEFIGAVESLPICRELTDHLLGLAVAQLAEWQAMGLYCHISVNLSARDASDPKLPETIERLLTHHGVDVKWLEVELTESTLLANADQTRAVLGELRELGLEIAIDDYGTGYASLSYLASLPVTGLKVDQSFVMHMDTDPQAAAIVRHSIDLGHSLGMTVVAEGIETAEVAQLLSELGCDVAQGYAIARPMPAADVPAWVQKSKAWLEGVRT